MKLYDISLNLSEDTVRWATSTPFELVARRRMSRGDANNSSGVAMSLHAGTHIDAPFHFVADGETTDGLALERFIGPAVVHAVDADRYIEPRHLADLDLNGVRRVLFKTRNSALLRQKNYEPNFVAFSVAAAELLAAHGLALVGLDYLSVAHAGDEQVPVHRAFLTRGVALLEGVDLSDVAPGRYELICFPIKVRGADGAPCRAVLRDLE
ncbi:MAG TPA: cyclase family protein [Candidatus Binatia bacterium]|jgi:arylformamidase